MPPRMSADEKRLVREMHFDRDMPPARIAEVTGRCLSSITRLLAQTRSPNPIGRPKALSDTQVDALVRKLEGMVNEAAALYEVTLPMLMRRARVKVSARVVANALHERGYWFRDLRCKPILTPDDVKERFAWAKKYHRKSADWWLRTVHVHLDNHAFKVATTSAGRKLKAKRAVRGVYRAKGKSLNASHVKPNPRQHRSLGAKGILKAGGVGGGKVLVWHTIDQVWGGSAAETMYRDAVGPALQRRYPGKRFHTILEDNDPTGNLSKKGIAAKVHAKLRPLKIPKRSPDLNVLDYAVWSEVEKRMRRQERAWPASRRETRAAFEKRLDSVAKKLPESFINKAIGNLQHRCQLLLEAKGGLFEEGGRSRRPL